MLPTDVIRNKQPRMSGSPHDMAAHELHTFLFADIAGYSLLTELDGDEAAADLAMRFVSDASSIACDHGAEVVKGLGDAVMVHADDAGCALRLALDLFTEVSPGRRMPPIHAGLHTGPAVGRLGDWWGATVNIAARVAAAAGPGQVLLTEATRAAAGEMDSIHLRELGPLRLRNITLPVKIYAASRVPLAHWAAPPRRAPERRRAAHA
jgi:adenylate cyclase